MTIAHPPLPEARRRPTVLVVEDDPDLRHTIVTFLQERRGYTVLPASDGEEAQQWAQREGLEIDVALIDIMLPDSFGSQVALEQTVLRPGIRTIYMSGHLPDDNVLASSVPETSTFLQKPFTLPELAAAIEAALTR